MKRKTAELICFLWVAAAYIALILDESGGNVAEAARRLGVARKTLYARRTSS